jgi:tetratricopeptide (TPR) repeat protein
VPAAEKSPPSNVRRDPAGRTGISPTWEAIKRGDDAYIANNVDAAIKEYQAAIEARPQHPVAHYRFACALISKGELKHAQEELTAALRFAQSDAQTAAKILFVFADLKERQQDYAGALAAWKSYAAFANGHKDIKTFPDSAASRQDKINQYTKLLEQSNQVKQRIAERQQITESKATEDAKASKSDDEKPGKAGDAKKGKK